MDEKSKTYIIENYLCEIFKYYKHQKLLILKLTKVKYHFLFNMKEYIEKIQKLRKKYSQLFG